MAWQIVLQPQGLRLQLPAVRALVHVRAALRDTPIQLLDTRTAVQIGVVYNYLPLMIFPLWVALDRVELHLREASQGPRRRPTCATFLR